MSEENKKTKPTLSFSAVSTFLKCPRLYYLEHVKGVETFANGAMIQSSAWHAAAAKNFMQKVKSKEDMPVKNVVAIFMDRLNEKFKIENVKLKENESRPVLEAQGVAITEFFHTQVAHTIQPLLVERYFRVSLGNAFPFDLSGIWDLIDVENRIRDLKAYGKTPSEGDIAKDLQLTWYALGYRISYKEPEGGLQIDAVIKNKTLKYESFPTTRTKDDCQWALGLIESAAKDIGRGCDFPNPNGWWCGPKMCNQWELCRGGSMFHGGKKT